MGAHMRSGHRRRSPARRIDTRGAPRSTATTSATAALVLPPQATRPRVDEVRRVRELCPSDSGRLMLLPTRPVVSIGEPCEGPVKTLGTLDASPGSGGQVGITALPGWSRTPRSHPLHRVLTRGGQ